MKATSSFAQFASNVIVIVMYNDVIVSAYVSVCAQVRSIMGQVRPDRQTLLFTATMPTKVDNLVRDCLTTPVRITVGEVGAANQDIQQVSITKLLQSISTIVLASHAYATCAYSRHSVCMQQTASHMYHSSVGGISGSCTRLESTGDCAETYLKPEQLCSLELSLQQDQRSSIKLK